MGEPTVSRAEVEAGAKTLLGINMPAHLAEAAIEGGGLVWASALIETRMILEAAAIARATSQPHPHAGEVEHG